MTKTNPQIEKILDELAEVCCEALNGKGSTANSRSEALLKSLLMSGYVRMAGRDLRAPIEARVKNTCREPAMHRTAELSGLTQQLQEEFDKLARWESDRPEGSPPAKSANISSSTDS